MSQQQSIVDDVAVAPEGPEIVSEFPAPPAFFALYRDGADCGPPPPEPMAPTYHMFGTPYSTQDVVPDLLPQDGRKLYLGAAASVGNSGASSSGPANASSTSDAADGDDSSTPQHAVDATTLDDKHIDYKGQMKKINRSLLANFVELVDVLIKRPSMFNEKLDDIEQLFLNMHNLINAFRPHQARETIIEMLRTQIHERREAASDIRKTVDDARKAVESVHLELHDDTSRSSSTTETRAAADRKMDVDGDDNDASAQRQALANGQLASPRSSQPIEQSARAREARQLQEDFFGALDAALTG